MYPKLEELETGSKIVNSCGEFGIVIKEYKKIYFGSGDDVCFNYFDTELLSIEDPNDKNKIEKILNPDGSLRWERVKEFPQVNEIYFTPNSSANINPIKRSFTGERQGRKTADWFKETNQACAPTDIICCNCNGFGCGTCNLTGYVRYYLSPPKQFKSKLRYRK
jgi:hypothetical protein